MPTELPLNTAHIHAANADDHVAAGLLMPAAEEHRKAAEAYMAAHDNSSDESTKRTLRLLHNKHTQATAELQRKIEQLRAQGKDPSLPQIAQEPSSAFFHPRESQSRSATRSPSLEKQLADTVDESFMILPGQRSDPADSFNQFWNVMQLALDNHLTQGVAFATIPLGPEKPRVNGAATPPRQPLSREGSHGSDADAEEPMMSRITKGLQGLSSRIPGSSKIGRSSFMSSDVKPPETDLDDMELNEDELSDFILISPDSPQDAHSPLHQENLTLKAELEGLKKRMQTMERNRREHDMQLRDSVYQVAREAHRVFTGRSQTLGEAQSSQTPSREPVIGVHSVREGQYYRRVQELDRRNKELEDELRQLRVENEKHKALNAKFRERWEKLKESARRKKELKAKTGITKQTIEEDPEAEERLDSMAP
ncbi:hypothetical protein DL96DRAFT_1577546 [Flagelloscypha sp. PMI_526]|nr:hypothetical protein DL96DRAFT_1577546 [Flagelloscypha sp. PMI_526]